MKFRFLCRTTTTAACLVCLGAALAVSNARAGLIKASPAPPSPFLEHPETMAPDHRRTPFDRVWRTAEPAAWQRVAGFDRVVIPPVNTAHLRASPRLSTADARAMATYMRAEFQQAFARGGRFQVMEKPGKRTLRLELALVELRPSNVPGNIINTGVGTVIPGANLLGSILTHGTIAFEAKLRNAETGELLAQYADRQFDKLTLFSFRDYSPYAHDRKNVQDWAERMHRLATTPPTQKVPGAMRFTFDPF